MKRDKICYWIATGFVAAAAFVAAIMYFVSPEMAEGFKHLGFPDYFRVELGIAKLVGAFTLLLPMISNRVKEWTYAGFAIVFMSACTAHIVVEGASAVMAPLIQLLVLIVSYVYFNKLRNGKELTMQ